MPSLYVLGKPARSQIRATQQFEGQNMLLHIKRHSHIPRSPMTSRAKTWKCPFSRVLHMPGQRLEAAGMWVCASKCSAVGEAHQERYGVRQAAGLRPHAGAAWSLPAPFAACRTPPLSISGAPTHCTAQHRLIETPLQQSSKLLQSFEN